MTTAKLMEKVEIFKLLGSKIRLQILIGLKPDGCNVKLMQKNLGLPQSTISQHLKMLKMSGIVQAVRKGNTVCYRVIDPLALKIVNMIKNEEL